MAATTDLHDPARWQVSLLPLPKRQRAARPSGFCGGYVVGESEGFGWRGKPCWWPQGLAVPIALEGQKSLHVRHASGRVIPGYWTRASSGHGGAVGWRLQGGELHAQALHPQQGWQWTAALGAGGDSFAGYGLPKAAKGEKAVERALFWKADGGLIELPTSVPGAEALAEMTDGRFVVGRQGRTGAHRAALWPADGSGVTILGDNAAISQAYGVGDGEQVGVRWTGRGGSAVLWRGSADSRADLNPKGFDTSVAHACGGGFQVGSVTRRAETASGAGSMFSRAALWTGTAGSFFDLQALLPEPWNASYAVAMDVSDGYLRIAGTAMQVVVEHELTKREMHLLGAQGAVLWQVRLP